jgi:RHS repeat-associated protein
MDCEREDITMTQVTTGTGRASAYLAIAVAMVMFMVMVFPQASQAQTQTVPANAGPWMLGIGIGGSPPGGPFFACPTGSTEASVVQSTIGIYNSHRLLWFPSGSIQNVDFYQCGSPGFPLSGSYMWASGSTGLCPDVGLYGTFLINECWTSTDYGHSGLSAGCLAGGAGDWGVIMNNSYCIEYQGDPLHFGVPVNVARGLSCPPEFTGHYSGTVFDCIIGDNDVCPIGDPVCPFNGANLQEESDYRAAGAGGLEFTRYYRSTGFYTPYGVTFSAQSVGSYWQHTYERRLLLLNYGGILATYEAPDGQMRHFATTGAEILNRDGAAAKLLSQVDGTWIVVMPNSDQEHFDATGRLVSITPRGGATTTVSYGANGLVSVVTDQFGKTLQFGYDTQGRLASVTLPDNGVISLAYDVNGNLWTVTYPDQSVKTYNYGGPGAGLLTSIVDESNSAFATFSYDTLRRATNSQHAGGVESYGFAYTTQNGTLASTTVTDPLLNQRTYSMTSVGGVFRLSDLSAVACATCDTTASSNFDANGNVSSRVDFNGNRACYEYDLLRNLETTRLEGIAPGVSCPSNLSTYTPAAGTRQRKITENWAANFRLPLSITEASHTTSFTYDASGNALTNTVTDTSVTPNVSRTWTYTYNTYGQVLTVDGPRTDVVDKTTYSYYSCATGYQCGQLHTVTNAANQVTTFNTYNAHGEPLSITDPNNVVTTLTYDARQRLKSRQVGTETTTFDYYQTGLLQKVTLPDQSYIQYSYDPARRLTAITDSLGNRIAYVLDSLGNRTAETAYDPSNVLSRAVSQLYNALGQLSQRIGAAGTTAVTTTFGYDNNGNQATVSAPMGRNTVNGYDELNRLNQITDPATGNTRVGYDADDNVTSVQEPTTLTTGYVYNGFGDVKQLISPSTGTSNNTYDSGGNLNTSTDARGVGGTYSYDTLNRVTQIAYGDQTLVFGYDAGTYGKGHLTSASDAAHSMSWVYDALGRVSSKSQTVGGVARTVGYGYASGLLTSITTPSGQAVVYSYANGRVTGITVNGSAVLSGVLYDPFGPARAWTWGNSTTETRLHDTDGNPSFFTGAESTSYSLDNAFRIQGVSNSNTTTASWTYGYDLLDRVTSGTNSAGNPSWTYDASGNRQTQGGAAGPAYAASGITFGYNNRGRMASATANGTTTYVYNALGQRIQKSGPGGTTVFSYDEAGHLLGEYTGTGTLVQETIWLGDLPVATIRPGTPLGIYYVHANHLGTPRIVTRSSDNSVVWRWDSDPFGVAIPNQNPVGLGVFNYNLRNPGQYFDGETGLNYNYFRDYDGQTGRYTESDPLGLAGASYSTYAYEGGNPVSGIDPLGLATLVIGSGPIASNPGGHVALAFTGQGVYSYGTAEPYGASTTGYIEAALANRSVTLTVLNTTPAQEEVMRKVYAKHYGPHSKYSVIYGHDCAGAAIDALIGADALDKQIVKLIFDQDAPMLLFLPSTVVAAAALQPGGINIFLSRGSAVPANLGSFNR